MTDTTPNSISPSLEIFGNQPAAEGLSLSIFTNWLRDIQNQPTWRYKADIEMEYVDGNQLSSEVLEAQKQRGIPPAIEPLIGPAIEAVVGLEAKTRMDWRVESNGDDGDDVAKALGYKLNQAERHSGADKACSNAFKPQACVGLGWVEVSRESDPFKFPYRCTDIHRNEMFWDMLDRDMMLGSARYLIRRRWTDVAQAKIKFKEHADLIQYAYSGWAGLGTYGAPQHDGGTSTNMAMAWDQQRGWSIEESEWLDTNRARVCLFECWYRRWEEVLVLTTPDGRVVEYNETNAVHVIAVASGQVIPRKATVSRMYQSYWLGPHKLYDGKTPYRHNKFPYVPFWGKKEDRTGVPYGLTRGMVYLQDNVNASISKIRWGLSAIRTERTKGVVAMKDEQFRQAIARVDADIILDPVEMAKPGAMFKVYRDFQLTEQQYKMLDDSRRGIERASGITNGFAGREGTATSGVQEQTQVEQSVQSLAGLMDNFKFARAEVGELLLSMIVEDMIDKPNQQVVIKGNVVTPDKTVTLNVPVTDEASGIQYMDNDVSRIMLRVEFTDVPSTPTFRAQQLSAMSEAFKSMPQQYQIVALPHLLALMDVPDKEEIITAIQAASDQKSPEQIQQMIDQAVKQALKDSGNEIKMRELDLKYAPDKLMAEIQNIVANTVKVGVESSFAAMQAAQVIATMPQVAPVADAVMQGAGYQHPSPAGVDPNFPTAAGPVPQLAAPAQGVPPPEIHTNTSPALPPVPQQAASAMQGIETPRTTDNMAASA